jgi:hypothetical protein
MTLPVSVLTINVVWVILVTGVYIFFQAIDDRVNAEYTLLFSPATAFGYFFDPSPSIKQLEEFTFTLYGAIFILCFVTIYRSMKEDLLESIKLCREKRRETKTKMEAPE